MFVLVILSLSLSLCVCVCVCLCVCVCHIWNGNVVLQCTYIINLAVAMWCVSLGI